MKKVAFHTLGCKVNQYETEAMKEEFVENGYFVVGEMDYADVYVINTCTVTSMADKKSRQYIRRMKKKNPESVVAVTGCYVQVNESEVSAIEEVNIVCGINEKSMLFSYVDKYIQNDHKEIKENHVLDFSELDNFDEMGIVVPSDSRNRAYIKIEEGCNRFCSYCIIPYARGPVRSRELDVVLTEARKLVSKGYKEIVLTGINTALCDNLDEILEGLDNMEGDFRVRLSSLEPTVVNKEYVKHLEKYKRLCHHLHLSVQSGSDSILESMNRRYNREEYLEIVEVLRDMDPDFGITTDIIVGFPGETQEDFEDSLDLVNKSKYCRVHAFQYSKREGTPAAKMTNQINLNTKKERSKQLIKASEKVAKDFAISCKGKKHRVLFEEYLDSGYLTGYTDNYIKVYYLCDKEAGMKLVNTFADTEIESILYDGALVSIG